jgi:hypothetical protein
MKPCEVRQFIQSCAPSLWDEEIESSDWYGSYGLFAPAQRVLCGASWLSPGVGTELKEQADKIMEIREQMLVHAADPSLQERDAVCLHNLRDVTILEALSKNPALTPHLMGELATAYPNHILANPAFLMHLFVDPASHQPQMRLALLCVLEHSVTGTTHWWERHEEEGDEEQGEGYPPITGYLWRSTRQAVNPSEDLKKLWAALGVAK